MTTSRRALLATLIGGLVPRPRGARAQPPTVPVVGLLSSLSANDRATIVPAFQQGLGEASYVEGRNVVIEYRWADGQYNRLSALAADLVRRRVAVIAALSGTPAGLAAKGATTTIPIVFAIGGDPVAHGLVKSLNRPTANVTGVTFFTAQLGSKRLGLLRELVPNVMKVAVLVNPNNPPSVTEAASVQTAAQALGSSIRICHAAAAVEIERAFDVIVHERIGALCVTADPVFLSQRDKVVALAARHGIPAIYADREIAEAGGLISYGASRPDAYRQAGIYVGRILKGEKPSNLPVIAPTTFELVINLKTAKGLGLAISPAILLRANQIIE